MIFERIDPSLIQSAKSKELSLLTWVTIKIHFMMRCSRFRDLLPPPDVSFFSRFRSLDARLARSLASTDATEVFLLGCGISGGGDSSFTNPKEKLQLHQ
jgi:hypothetical protein